ncbi:hypothetical protein [Phyllobacterium sophorae]|uniref:Uncharacterized protein n=1 Tax=Phyllobacterium sophorae TaxID=1520277 RepID=A0A2P7BFD8_9HYPH|nr:hypothetical protein [Phyllobacterium sophorae]PSH65180.1 hypothetical protein CU103_09165 [Phyllobacterium sophorae]
MTEELIASLKSEAESVREQILVVRESHGDEPIDHLNASLEALEQRLADVENRLQLITYRAL